MSWRPVVLTTAAAALVAIGCVTTVPAATPTTAPSTPTIAATLAPTVTPAPTATPTPTASASPTATGSPTPSLLPSLPPSPTPTASAPTGGLVTGTGQDLCPTNEELPAGYDPFTTSQDNTPRAREVVFVDAPAELGVQDRLLAAWSAFAELSLEGTAPACGAYVFDAADIEDVYAWYADTFADRSAFPLTALPAPAGSPGSDGRLFYRTTSDQTESFTYLFHQHNVIAALTLDGPSAVLGGTSSPDEVIALANTTSGRIDQNAAGASLPTPTTGAQGPFPTAAESELLTHVPDAFRASCDRATFAVAEEATAAVVCSTEAGEGQITVTYQSFSALEQMQDAYARTLDFLGIEAGTGPCSGAWPGEGSYTIGGIDAGQIGCGDLGGAAAIISWTDERLSIHGYAEGFGVSTDAMYQWWLSDSGPI